MWNVEIASDALANADAKADADAAVYVQIDVDVDANYCWGARGAAQGPKEMLVGVQHAGGRCSH